MQKITPFLWFEGRAEEAMNFYVAIFKNSKKGKVVRYGDAGPGPKGTVMTASFQLDGQEFIALNCGPPFKAMNSCPSSWKLAVMTVSFQLDGQEFIALNGGPQFKAMNSCPSSWKLAVMTVPFGPGPASP